MARLTVGKAARAVGVNRSTVQRYIASGKLSCDLEPNGARVIDVAELERVFGVVRLPAAPGSSAAPAAKQHPAAPQIEALRQRVQELETELAKERELRDRLLGMVETGQRLLTDQRPAVRSSWWRRWWQSSKG